MVQYGLTLLASIVFLTSCDLQSDEEVLDDIATELNEKTTDETNTKKK